MNVSTKSILNFRFGDIILTFPQALKLIRTKLVLVGFSPMNVSILSTRDVWFREIDLSLSNPKTKYILN